MKLNPLGANMTQLELDDGTIILFSYKTPVAARIMGIEGLTIIRTLQWYSNTTAKHINKWLAGWNKLPVKDVKQKTIDMLV